MSTATSTADSYKKIVKVHDLKTLSEAKNKTRAMMVNRILDLLMPPTGRTAWKAENTKLIARLTSTPDLAYLQRVLDLAAIAGDNAKYAEQNRRFLIRESSGGQRYKLNTVHANREFLHEQDNDMSMFVFALGEMRLFKYYESTDRIPTLAAHFIAFRNYGFVGEGGVALAGCHSYGTSQLSKLVEKRPGMVKLILDYRDMMGTIDITETGFRVFAAKHNEFNAEQERAIWQTRSNRAYSNGTLVPLALSQAVISRSEWEQVQDRESVMALR